MKVIAVIPARYGASRFPGKLLEKLGNHSVIASTYLAVKNSGLFHEVIVATDDQRIVDEISEYQGTVVLTSSDHQSGSDRIAEVIKDREVDIVVNVQGDEPFTASEPLAMILEVFKEDVHQKVDVATLMEKMKDPKEIKNPNNVKVVFDAQHYALYFSRSVIPFSRDTEKNIKYFKHIGIYAYRKKALLNFTQMPTGRLEEIEKLEQLRYLENGYRIKMIETQHPSIGIDTPEDLENARLYLKKMEQ